MPLLLAAAVPVLTGTAAVPAAAAAAAILGAPILIGAAATAAAGFASMAIYKRLRHERLAAAGRAIGEALKRCKHSRCGMPLDENGHCLSAYCMEPDAPAPSVGLVPVCPSCNSEYPKGSTICPSMFCID